MPRFSLHTACQTLVSAGVLVIGQALPAWSLSFVPSAAVPNYKRCARELLAAGLAPEMVTEACALAVRPEELSKCVSRVSAAVDLDPTVVLRSCFQVRRPVDLSKCVVDINKSVLAPYLAQVDMGSVGDAGSEEVVEKVVAEDTISEDTVFDGIIVDGETIEDEVIVEDVIVKRSPTELLAYQTLTSCQRSLLPERFSRCVIGINRSTQAADVVLAPDDIMGTCLDAEDYPRELFFDEASDL
ncbi:MAG: hypothetical protein AAGG02_02285 [Cyanobacteria bacterium P01_H01_bin.15]